MGTGVDMVGEPAVVKSVTSLLGKYPLYLYLGLGARKCFKVELVNVEVGGGGGVGVSNESKKQPEEFDRPLRSPGVLLGVRVVVALGM